MAQFHRFRINEYTKQKNKSSNPPTSTVPAAPSLSTTTNTNHATPYTIDDKSQTPTKPTAGVVTRFRVSDFVPWDTVNGPPNGTAAASSDTSPTSSKTPNTQQFYMDFNGSTKSKQKSAHHKPPMTGMGKLVGLAPKSGKKVTQSASTQPAPSTARSRNDSNFLPGEWARILSIMKLAPPQNIVAAIAEALIGQPQDMPDSLLDRLCEVFPLGYTIPSQEQFTTPSNNTIPQSPTKKCLRCHKVVNPLSRPESNSCSIPHPYKNHEEGLVLAEEPDDKNGYKPTWKWICCGKTIEGTSGQSPTLPRPEQDKTNGVCRSGSHIFDTLHDTHRSLDAEGEDLNGSVDKEPIALIPEIIASGLTRSAHLSEVESSPQSNKKRKLDAPALITASDNLVQALSTTSHPVDLSSASIPGAVPGSYSPPKRKRGRPKGSFAKPKPPNENSPRPDSSRGSDTDNDFWAKFASNADQLAADINPKLLQSQLLSTAALTTASPATTTTTAGGTSNTAKKRGRPKGSKNAGISTGANGATTTAGNAITSPELTQDSSSKEVAEQANAALAIDPNLEIAGDIAGIEVVGGAGMGFTEWDTS